MGFLQESWVCESASRADAATGELVAYIRCTVAVSVWNTHKNVETTWYTLGTYPTQANFVVDFPYCSFTALTHFGTATFENAMCFLFHAS